MSFDTPIVLFDGVCNFCNGTVNFLIKQDKKNILRFAALQSGSGQKLLKQYGLSAEEFESFLFIEKGKVYKRSSAALTLARKLSWHWQWTQVFWLVPKILRDGLYSLIARNRYKWFGKKETCMIPAPEVNSRFLA